LLLGGAGVAGDRVGGTDVGVLLLRDPWTQVFELYPATARGFKEKLGGLAVGGQRKRLQLEGEMLAFDAGKREGQRVEGEESARAYGAGLGDARPGAHVSSSLAGESQVDDGRWIDTRGDQAALALDQHRGLAATR